jgi:hypothetical protein
LKWYTASTGGTGSATAPTPLTTSAGTANYYVSETTNNCESARSLIAVAVNALPSAPTVTTPVTYCQNATATALAATGAALKWYTASTGGPVSSTAPTPVTGAAGTTNYYVSQTTNNCESPRALIVVTVNTVAIATVTANGPLVFCQGESVTLTANAASSYKWFDGSTQVGSSISYAATTAGNYTVEVTSASNCKDLSSTVTVTVNPLPVAVITSSGPLSFPQGGSVILTSSAGSSYKWFNGTTQIGTGSIYTATTSGDYSVEVTNAAGCKNVSSAVTVNIISNKAPAVSISSPMNNASFAAPANVTLTAVATDSDGTIVKVDFYNGTTLVGTDPTSAYNFALNNLAAGSYSITAVATDNNGASATSAIITFTVNVPVNQLPVITITAPLGGSTYVEPATVIIEASASDPDGTISQVEFYNGNILLGSDASSPYSFTWSSVTSGSYNITARAVDNNGGIVTSSPVSITVNGNQPSVITITSPVDNSSITGTSVTISVSATDPDGSITLVEYYDGTTLIGSSSSQPYSYTWDNPPAGIHVITVRVTDSNGGVTTSSPSTFIVQIQTGLISGNDVFNKIYPNPSGGMVYIETRLDLVAASIKLMDAFGSEVSVPFTIATQNATADVSALPAGVYFLLITQDEALIRKKIIVLK